MTNSVVTTTQYTGTTPVTVTGSRTLTNEDNGFNLVYRGSTPITLTIPPLLNPGFGCAVTQKGGGQITFAATLPATYTNVDSFIMTSGQGAVMAIINDGVDSYSLCGPGA